MSEKTFTSSLLLPNASPKQLICSIGCLFLTRTEGLKFYLFKNIFRISVEEALRHPYIADYYLAEEDEMTIGQPPFDIEDNENSSTAKTIADWRGF